ncbi:leucine-rich repeat-containing protein 56-like isoform X2 [Acanthaster planci]|uniref:Leucine-rich repeat-containing protein 56-like isoform X2 n=1 Tax=Acanthaster planci TaxID=133434 RepID=A0A8B7XUM5_ACAPL|nr:leucine-rich repeat-containing protein 56-like isoform X2 [Acanthaster planci]
MASVHITDFGSATVNPQPIPVEDTEFLLEDYLSSAKMKEMTGVDDLDDVKYLEMRVDTTETSLGNFGTMVPNLKYLKLSNSIIATVRDLGTSLENLSVLWMPRCSLCDLDGMGSMSSLQELYLAYNTISDLSPCSMLESLQLLDLEGNNIDDMSQVEFLSLCPKLTTLTLEGNPVCQAPCVDYNKDEEGEFDYRAATSKAIPQLTILDDDPLSVVPSSLGRTSANISMEWLLVNEAIKDQGSNEKLEVEDGRPGTARPSSASNRRPGSTRPGSARPGSARPGSARPSSSGARPGSSLGTRPGTASGTRPGTAQGERPDTGGSDIHPTQEDASDLTHGSGGVICGNPVRALRKRRRRNKDTTPPYQPASIFSMFQHQPDHSYVLEEEEDGKSKEDIFAELTEWKQQHEAKILARIKESEPQVLKIHHSDDDDSTQDYFNNLGYDEDYRLASPSPTSDYPESLASGGMDREPTPPLAPSPKIPQAPKSRATVRPKTANDFRSRRVRVRSFEDNQGLDQRLQDMHLSMDDDMEASDSGQTSPAVMQYSPPPIVPAENRPFSGPVVGTRKFKINPENSKPEPKNIDRHQPVIRSSINTPPNLAYRLSRLARPSTARAAMQLQRPPRLPSREPRFNSFD